MRKLFVAVLAILFLLPVFSNAQSQRDGKWWKKLDQNAKIYFVAGILEWCDLGRCYVLQMLYQILKRTML
jgi:hypothetical protein